MKQKILIGMFLIIMCLTFLIPNKSLAVESSSGGYVIQNYDINMVVNENNTFDITESITAYFNVGKHGIYRKIPLNNSIERNNGTTSNNIAKITDISVSEKYTTSIENGYKVIKIGDANSKITGKHNYVIKYKYNIGKDPLKGVDELYYNLIGDQWHTKIENVSFTITMPKAFDESLLGFSSGRIGSADSSNITYNVDGNIIIGNIINPIKSGGALTVRVTLPEEYFVGESENIDLFSIFIVILFAVFIFIAFKLWIKYGKDDQIVETIEFYPPEEYNSAEIGFLYKGSADTKGIISLLIYLANKGYLKIEEIEKENKGKFSKNKDFKITKLKEYDGKNQCEKIFFYGLFKGPTTRIIDGNQVEERSIIVSDLYNRFYRTLNRIKSIMNLKEYRDKIFESSFSGKGKYLILMIIAIFLLITVRPIIEYSDITSLFIALLLPRNRYFYFKRKIYGWSRNKYIKNFIDNIWNNIYINTFNHCITDNESKYNIFNNIYYWYNYYCNIDFLCYNNA